MRPWSADREQAFGHRREWHAGEPGQRVVARAGVAEPHQSIGIDRRPSQFFRHNVEWLARRPDAAIARLAAMPRDWLDDSWYHGPKGLLVGDALQLAGRPDAAALEWRGALTLVQHGSRPTPTTSRC